MQKTIHYRRAIWLVEGRQNRSLQAIVQRALRDRPDVDDTKFEYRSDLIAQVSERSSEGVGFGCYFTMFTEGAPAATVANGGATIRRRRAPPGEEFLRTGIFILLLGNNVAYVSNGQTNDGQITNLISLFLRTCGLDEADTQFDLMARANREEVSRLLSTGVKSIDMGFAAFATTIEALNNSSRSEAQLYRRFRNAVANGFATVFSPDRRVEEVEAASEVEAIVHLKFDGRTASPDAPLLLGKFAQTLEGSVDEFKIVTTQNAVITRDKLIVKIEAAIEGDHVSLNSYSAFNALRDAMRAWRRQGVLEQ